MRNIEEYKKELTKWVEEHPIFYKEYVHAVKSKRATLAAYMHIYEFAMSLIPNLPDKVELGDCDDLFKIYYTKYGFNKFIGQLVTLWGNDKIMAIKSIAQRKKLKKAIVSWLVIGDMHTCIVNKINSYPKKDNYEVALNKLINRIIRNSIYTKIKDESFWLSSNIRTKLFLSDDELRSCLMIPKQEKCIEKVDVTQSPADDDANNIVEVDVTQAPTEGVNKTECNDSKESANQLNLTMDRPKIPAKRGRPAAFSDDTTLTQVINKEIHSINIVKDLVKEIIGNIEKCQEDKDRALLIVALESCEVIPILKGNGVRKFCEIINVDLTTKIQYRTFINYYNHFESYREKVKQEGIAHDDGELKAIKFWYDKFINMLQEPQNSSSLQFDKSQKF